MNGQIYAELEHLLLPAKLPPGWGPTGCTVAFAIPPQTERGVA